MKCMHLFFVVSTLGIFSISQGFGNETQSSKCREKIYVHSNQVSVSQNGIYVNVNNQWIPTDSLHTDAQGIYVMSDALVDEKNGDPCIGYVLSAATKIVLHQMHVKTAGIAKNKNEKL